MTTVANTPAVPAMFALNNFAFYISLQKIDPDTGVKSKFTGDDGTVSGFCSTGADYAATAAHVDFSIASLIWVDAVQKWFVFIEGSKIVGTLADSFFLAAHGGNFITIQAGGIRTYTPFTYATKRPTA